MLSLAVEACQRSNYLELKAVNVPIDNRVAALLISYAQLVDQVVDVVERVHVDILQVFIHLPLPGYVDSDWQELGHWSRLFHVSVVAALQVLDRLVELRFDGDELLLELNVQGFSPGQRLRILIVLQLHDPDIKLALDSLAQVSLLPLHRIVELLISHQAIL